MGSQKESEDGNRKTEWKVIYSCDFVVLRVTSWMKRKKSRETGDRSQESEDRNRKTEQKVIYSCDFVVLRVTSWMKERRSRETGVRTTTAQYTFCFHLAFSCLLAPHRAREAGENEEG